MHEVFEVARGSVIGCDHARDGKNNQDSHYVFQDNDITIALVGDGCSSSEFSHIGSYIGLRLIAKALYDRINARIFCSPQFFNVEFEKILERVRLDALANMRSLINDMEGNFKEKVLDAFLFTVVGCVISKPYSIFFSIGDGIFVINGEKVELGPFKDNAPPYIGYSLLDSGKVELDPARFRFVINIIATTDKLESAIIGCDGTKNFIASEEKNMPGKSEKVGSIFQFVENDKYFSNKFAIQRRLTMMNREISRIDWEKREVNKEGGLLPDDTTIVALRKRKNLSDEVA